MPTGEELKCEVYDFNSLYQCKNWPILKNQLSKDNCQSENIS